MTSSKPSGRRKAVKQAGEQISFDLKPNTKVQVTIETGDLKAGKMPVTIHMDQAETPVQEITTAPPSTASIRFSSLTDRLQQYNLATWLFILAIATYLVTRLVGLTQFPIYFFTDEAIQTQSIADLISNKFRDINGVFLPPYFRNGDYANLSLSVYLQWIPLLLFGKSAFVTRATSVLITLIAAISVGLILRDVFKSKYWWAGTLFLSITPSWFLHSRTAFETAEFTAFYAGTLCAYLFYRYKSPRYLYLVFLLGAMAFYSYSPGQFIVPVTALALLVSDWRYHWENRQIALKGMVLLAILAIPYLRYRAEYPSAAFSHLYTLNSYLVEDISLSEKIRRYLSEYALGLSTWYWYTPNNRDLPRHLMKDYGNILKATLPFAILGLYRILTNLRDPAHRTVLISMLAAPVSTALVQTSITRALVFVIPVAILTTLGLEQVLQWLESPAKNMMALNNQTALNARRVVAAILLLAAGILISSLIQHPEHRTDRIALLAIVIILALHISNVFEFIASRSSLQDNFKKWQNRGIHPAILALLVFLVLATTNIFMLYDSLKNGPVWFEDYGMGGMQYGALQIFDIIGEYKQEHPEARIIFSPNWANGTNIVARFFLDDPMPFEIASVEGHVTQKLELDDNTVFVMIPSEYQLAASSHKLTDLRVEKIVPYPNSTPGFYFVRFRYVDDIDQIFAAEKALRDIPRESVVTIDGQPVKLKHSYLDAGEEEGAQQSAINLVFDNDLLSLAKTFEANPFVIEMTFPSTRVVNGFSIVIGSARAHITLKCYSSVDAQPTIHTFEGQGSAEQPELSFDLPLPTEVRVLQIEMLDPLSTPPTKIHIWEITLR
jgi:4-amino-4-deoxy-L-arabinose transferase-like glycosyltransferase